MSKKMEDQLCRTCLAEADESIYKTVFLDQEELSLVEMLNVCTGLKVTESDEMLLNICNMCTDQIINYYVYRKKCWESHNLLLSQLEQSKLDSNRTKFESVGQEKVIYDEISLLSEYHKQEKTNGNIQKSTELTDQSNINCELCDNIYSSRDLLLEHLGKVHSILEYHIYDCKYCKKNFRSSRNLQRHILNIHEQSENNVENQFICHYCGGKFKTRKYLILHIRGHTGEKPYKCKFCEYRAAQRTTIMNHMRTHTNERPFKCDVCSKLFRTSSTRTTHRKGHFEETPYECIICSKKFKKRGIYRDHMMIHDPDKYISCKFCDKKFARKDNLNIHIKQHTGEKPHVCECCGKGFIRKHCWQTHMKNYHNQ